MVSCVFVESSDQLATLKLSCTKTSVEDSTPVDIPGLNYKTGKNKQQQQQQLNLSTSVTKPPTLKPSQSPMPPKQEQMSRETPPPPPMFSNYSTKPPPASMPQPSMNNSMPPVHPPQYPPPPGPFGMQRLPLPPAGNVPMSRSSFYDYSMTSDSMSGYGYPGPYRPDFREDHSLPPPPHMQQMMPTNMHPPGMSPFPHQNMYRNRFPAAG